MTKDRLAELRTRMAANQRGGDETQNRLDNSRVEIHMQTNGAANNQSFSSSGPGPELTAFFLKVESIEAAITQITASVEELDRIHLSILSTSWNTSDDAVDDKRSKAKLEDIMSDIKRMALATRTKLKNLQAELDAGNNNNSAEERMKRTQEARLTKRLVEIMAEYSRIQIDYREKCKSRIQRQLEVTGRVTTNEELEEMLESGNEQVFAQGVVLDSRQARQMLADIESRHEDIIKLEKSIRELHDLFLEMSLLVDQQGDMVDQIEYQVNQTTDHVENARIETQKAVELQISARKKKILIGICCIVLVVILIAILIPALKT